MSSYIKIRLLSYFLIWAAAVMSTLGVTLQNIPVQAIEEHDIPKVKCIYNGQEDLMNAQIINDEQELSRLDFPDLPDNRRHLLEMEEGETVTFEFEDEKPSEITAFLVDYDADVTEIYPLKKINDNIFEVTQTGIKTLEAVATFEDDTQVSYTLLVDVKERI
jgi:hypothetical protein